MTTDEIKMSFLKLQNHILQHADGHEKEALNLTVKLFETAVLDLRRIANAIEKLEAK